MRTQVMPESAVGTPWLERNASDEPVEKTALISFPFKIGRNDAADLHIDSNQVSREHAVITRHGKKYRVKDLGSTNGTFLNGEQVEEATLNDGDLLSIAEVEFTFFYGTPATDRQTATQVRPPSTSGSSHRDEVWETILAVRRAHEVVTRRSLRILFQPVIDLASGETFGYEALAAGIGALGGQPRCDHLTGGIECRANDRMRQLFRRLAIEDSISLPPDSRLFVAVTAAESAQPWLVDHLCQLREFTGGGRKLVVEIPDSAVRNTPEFRALRSELREGGFEVAYDDYASGKAHLAEREEVAGDFLKLAPATLRSIHHGENRQRQVQLIVRASQDSGCAVIATGIDSEGDLTVARDLGCSLAQGELLGRSQPASSLVRPVRSGGSRNKTTK